MSHMHQPSLLLPDWGNFESSFYDTGGHSSPKVFFKIIRSLHSAIPIIRHDVYVSSHFCENDQLCSLVRFTGGQNLLCRSECWGSAANHLQPFCPCHLIATEVMVKLCHMYGASALMAFMCHIFYVCSVKHEQMKIHAVLPFLFTVQLQQSTAGVKVSFMMLINDRVLCPQRLWCDFDAKCAKNLLWLPSGLLVELLALIIIIKEGND